MPQSSHVIHPIPPVFNQHSQVLFLGTMPSPKSREAGFYYMHPQNRFWPLLSLLFSEPFAFLNKDALHRLQAVQERRDCILRHHLALWDVLRSCSICGAGDSTIRNPVPNDFRPLFSTASIAEVFCTGTTAYKLYTRYCQNATGLPAVCLPSTSPANQGRWPMDKLARAYRQAFAAAGVGHLLPGD